MKRKVIIKTLQINHIYLAKLLKSKRKEKETLHSNTSKLSRKLINKLSSITQQELIIHLQKKKMKNKLLKNH